MSDSLYSPSYSAANNIFSPSTFPKHPLDCNQQTYNFMPPNIFNQPNAAVESYISTPQHAQKTQNMCMYPAQSDVVRWDHTRSCDETLKTSDKTETIDITCKDLSPASYCSNMDLLMPDFCKNFNKDFNYSQWLSNSNPYPVNQKDFPSCAQTAINTESPMDKTVKYCSIQPKVQDFDFTNYNISYSHQNYSYKGFVNKNDNINSGNCYGFNYQGNKVLDPMLPKFFDAAVDSFQPFDQQTEVSNEESDIVVEESDEDVTESNDYDGNKIPADTTRCGICNVAYRPLGTQFYYLTLQNPLTMSSQKPVLHKITNIVGSAGKKIRYLCNICLCSLNTIDHLQLKLANFQSELIVKFRKTCQENNILVGKSLQRNKFHIKSNDKKIQCKRCKKVLSLRDMCLNHAKKHRRMGFLCDVCGQIFPNRHKFRSHYKKHKDSLMCKIKSFRCSHCPNTFRTKSNLKEHENYCLGILPFSCKFCDKKFPSSSKLKNHIKLKHDKKFIAICSICNIGFVKLSDYKSHKISHSTEKKFACIKCDKCYKTLSNLNFHMKVHNKKMPFVCHICEKGFMRKEYLEAHINNHKGVKNFGCSTCSKKFVSQKNLDAHMKYHDGSIKCNTCNLCGKVIVSGFEEHLRIHNNLQEFECDICDSRFNTKGTLAKHKKRLHPLNVRV